MLCALALPGALRAQTAQSDIIPVDLSVGRSFPIETPVAITRVSVANPDIADVAVIGERDVIINARAAGETDVLLWGANNVRRHYRVTVQSAPAGRKQISLAVKFAEVRRDVLRELGVSAVYRDPAGNVRTGTGVFRTDTPFDKKTGDITLPPTTGFLTVLTDFGTKDVLALLDAEEQRGNSRTLAQPTVMAANREEASFLAGGEIPIPIATPNPNGGTTVTIVFKEFGVRLNFVGELLGDSLVKLKVRPEVSSLDYGNAITLSGFSIPALRTRRMESTIDVRQNQSLIISGLFNDEREKVRTGIPGLMSIPILGMLFSSTRWQSSESELIVVVTPVAIDPMRPRARDLLPLLPDTALPARGALEKKLPPPPPPAGRP